MGIAKYTVLSIKKFLPCACVQTHTLDALNSYVNLKLYDNHSKNPTGREVLCRGRRGTRAVILKKKFEAIVATPAPICAI